jgi:tight adherence protein B
MRTARALCAALIGALVLTGAAAASTAELQIAPLTRLPFPERGYVLSLPTGTNLDERGVEVRENGIRVTGVRVDPLATSGLRFGVVLALDSSESMIGAPATAAIRAARAFVSHRAPAEDVGIVAFNGEIAVLHDPTRNGSALRRALASPPRLAYGTRINDALMRSLALLREAKLSSGSIVLLSDGEDIGSVHSLDEAVAAAKEQRVRVFTVGLRSGAFDSETLKQIAQRTGGSYAEAATAGELAAIYAALARRFAREYLVQYRSDAREGSQVEVRIDVAGVGGASAGYVAPTPAHVAPYHRSLLTRFLLSPGSIFALAVILALLVGWAVVRLVAGPKTMIVERIGRFATSAPSVRPARIVRPGRRYTSGWWARLERDLEIARMELSPRAVVAWTLAATLLAVIALGAVSKIVAVLGLLTPLVTRALIARKLKGIRNDFSDQLPTNLQVLASALRAGHSFTGALGVVVENAREPAQSELRRILSDDQLGVRPEQAIRRVAARMNDRDLEQVALLAELQRTSGGNAAEVLDTVVDTIRERGELRRLMRTLTAQGRMARWILTALPFVLAVFLWLIHPGVMAVFFETSGGQIALVVAALMVVAGSALIQRLVIIDV